MGIFPPKQITRWFPSRGEGYVSNNGGVNLLTQSGVNLLTQSGVDLITNPNNYSPKYVTTWAKSTKNTTAYRPLGGSGYVVNAGTLNLITNTNLFLIDNLGDYLVTTPTYVKPKNVTTWTPSGV